MNNAYHVEKETMSKPTINMGGNHPCLLGGVILLGLVMLSLAGCGGAGGSDSPTMRITPPSTTPPSSTNRYGAFAYVWWPVEATGYVAWVTAVGTTRSEAESKAEAYCRNFYSDPEPCSALPGFAQCGALATNGTPDGTRVAVGHGGTIAEAESSALSICNQGGRGQCRIATFVDATTSAFCVNN